MTTTVKRAAAPILRVSIDEGSDSFCRTTDIQFYAERSNSNAAEVFIASKRGGVITGGSFSVFELKRFAEGLIALCEEVQG